MSTSRAPNVPGRNFVAVSSTEATAASKALTVEREPISLEAGRCKLCRIGYVPFFIADCAIALAE
jgi:hypothetical protein